MTRIRKIEKKRSTAILLAVFFSGFTWLYTYKDDYFKFWISLVMGVLLWWTFIIPLGLWILAIADTCNKDDKWYKNY